jgi:hypothetical protein
VGSPYQKSAEEKVVKGKEGVENTEASRKKDAPLPCAGHLSKYLCLDQKIQAKEHRVK